MVVAIIRKVWILGKLIGSRAKHSRTFWSTSDHLEYKLYQKNLNINIRKGFAMPTGFSNERTAEYMILNDLYGMIGKYCTFFYPFYFHRKRDDTLISMEHDIKDLHLLICFARRPKTPMIDSGISIITFRESVFEHTNYFGKKSIPAIAGAPIGTSVEEIGFGSKCKWFNVKPNSGLDYVEYCFLDGEIDKGSTNKAVIPLEPRNLINIMKSAPEFTWIEIIEILRGWYNDYEQSRNLGLFYTIPGQKPIFIVYKM